MNTFYGLSDKTWTCGLYHPKVARYQLRHTQILLLDISFDLVVAIAVGLAVHYGIVLIRKLVKKKAK